jgi:hypothetical protein
MKIKIGDHILVRMLVSEVAENTSEASRSTFKAYLCKPDGSMVSSNGMLFFTDKVHTVLPRPLKVGDTVIRNMNIPSDPIRIIVFMNDIIVMTRRKDLSESDLSGYVSWPRKDFDREFVLVP